MKKKDLETKEKIMKAALGEIAVHGFKGTKMRAIAERAEVNQSLIHYYFKNKEHLYDEVITYFFDMGDDSKMIDPLAELPLQELDLTADKKIYILLYFIIKIHCQPELLQDAVLLYKIIYWELAENGKHLAKIYDKCVIPRIEYIANIIQEGCDEGIFECIDPKLQAITISNFLNDLFINISVLRDTKFEKIIDNNYGDGKILNYAIEQVLKMLCPIGKSFEIPEISDNTLVFVDMIIEKQTNSKTITLPIKETFLDLKKYLQKRDF